MRAGDGTLIGWGVAAGAYPGLIVPTVARLKLTDDASCASLSAGTRWVRVFAPRSPRGGAQACRSTGGRGGAGRRHRIAPQHVTQAPGEQPQPSHGERRREAMLQALDQLAPGRSSIKRRLKFSIRRTAIARVEVRRKAPGQPDAIYERLAAGSLVWAGPSSPTSSLSATSRISSRYASNPARAHPVPRVVSVADCGRSSAAHRGEQVRGGVVWGLGPLARASEVDPVTAGF